MSRKPILKPAFKEFHVEKGNYYISVVCITEEKKTFRFQRRNTSN